MYLGKNDSYTLHSYARRFFPRVFPHGSLYYVGKTKKKEFERDEGLYLKRFGRRLAEVRRAKGFTQTSLSTTAGIHRTYLAAVERGEYNVTLLNIRKLAKALDMTPAELMAVDFLST